MTPIPLMNKIKKQAPNYFFIHIEKTGGTSIEKALGLPKQNHVPYKHLPPNVKRDSFLFAFVRNPWDKVVSQYHFRKRVGQAMPKNLDFNSWLIKAYVENHKSVFDVPVMFKTCKWWISDDNNEVKVDFIGRFENITRDYNIVRGLIKEGEDLTHENATQRDRDYRVYYTDETAEIISNHFKEDIELFGYAF